MIKIDNNIFSLNTKKTSYIFAILESGQLEHLYYGKKINAVSEALFEKTSWVNGNVINYSKDYSISLENICLEMSSIGKGDIREPFIEITYQDGSSTSDFVYADYEIIKGKRDMETLPCSYGNEDDVMELIIKLKDNNSDLFLELNYCVYENENVITRSTRLINNSEECVRIDRIMSTQLDLDNCGYICTHFHGAWAREMGMDKVQMDCSAGICINSSRTGTSSSRANPFIILSEPDAYEESGECYGFNLVYSGNHYECVQVNAYGKTRVLAGISPDSFSYLLGAGETFEAPEAVMTYSFEGYQGISQNMHEFIRKHIVRGFWRDKVRPVLINSWEASYFNFNEAKLLSLAKKAKKAGIELFVMDDGWFGKRNDDTSSLGDWYVNMKKLKGGLKGLSNKLKEIGMDFGIWVEPEMISEDSDCYRNHPEWVVNIPGKNHSVGRNQMILDLTNTEVVNYVILQMQDVFSSADISYVKWDMNRIFSDYFSRNLPAERQKEFSHRYVMGLYKILNTLTKEFPNILFEGCAAGGNRFDLGMLCYMPQIWASDNTDAICRADIQQGYSYGYPMSVISAHVSECPNHQTLRNTSIETRFNVACFGLLGYECNLLEMSDREFEAVKNQVEWYKQWREVLQFGDFYRLKSFYSDLKGNGWQWMCVSKDKMKAVGVILQGQVTPNYGYAKFTGKGLLDDVEYSFYNRRFRHSVKEFGSLINSVSPVHIKKDSMVHNLADKFVKLENEDENYLVTGDVICYSGIKLKQGFMATGYGVDIRMFQDYASRLYVMEVGTDIAP